MTKNIQIHWRDRIRGFMRMTEEAELTKVTCVRTNERAENVGVNMIWELRKKKGARNRDISYQIQYRS